MNRIVTGLLVILALIILLGTACGSGDGNGRRAAITRTAAGFLSPTVQAARAEKLTFTTGSRGEKDRAFEGLNGTTEPMVNVPAGHARGVDDAPPTQAGAAPQITFDLSGEGTTTLSFAT